MVTEEDLKDLSELRERPEERKLNLIVEGKPPTCFGCGLKGRIRKRYPLNILQETEEANDFSKGVVSQEEKMQEEEVELEK